jgi:anti-sigma factor RsiW
MTTEDQTLDGLPEDLLSAYVDDELDDETRAAVETRLERSAEWRAVLVELQETRAALRALPSVDGAPEFWANVMAGAAPSTSDDDKVVDLAAERQRRRTFGWKVALAGAAAAAIVIVVGVAVVPGRDRVTPAVASFTDEHATRASVGDDVISHLAPVGVPGFER